MICPRCRSSETRVADSRPEAEGSVIRRRRICEAPGCGYRFRTYESTFDPTKERARKRRALTGWRAADPERARELDRRRNRRREARQEAARQGRPIEEVYREWGVA